MKTPFTDHETGETREVEDPNAIALPLEQGVEIYGQENTGRLATLRALVGELNAAKQEVAEKSKTALIIGHNIGRELIAAHAAMDQGTFDCIVEAAGLTKDEAAPLINFSTAGVIKKGGPSHPESSAGNIELFRQQVIDSACLALRILPFRPRSR